MDKRMKAMSIVGLILLLAGLASAQIANVTNQICNILNNVRLVLLIVAGGIGAVVITLQGIKWAASADDPGARKQAKEGIIHAVVGLIIVVIAVAIVMMVFGAGCGVV